MVYLFSVSFCEKKNLFSVSSITNFLNLSQSIEIEKQTLQQKKTKKMNWDE
jgi:hypothetical protein